MRIIRQRAFLLMVGVTSFAAGNSGCAADKPPPPCAQGAAALPMPPPPMAPMPPPPMAASGASSTNISNTHVCVETDVTPYPATPEYNQTRWSVSQQKHLTNREMGIFAANAWVNGSKLSVQFLDGSAAVQARVKAVAQTWSQFANIKFDFVSGDGQIRIAFQGGAGSWSYVGVDALRIPKPQPTMNLGWLDETTPDIEYQRVVLHEFGHALGCIHEHQNPGANIPWNKEAVYRFYAGPPNHWSQAQIDSNILKRFNSSTTNYSAFDKASIMEYPIPVELVTDAQYVVGWNTSLSETDKRFIAGAYPRK